MRLREPENLRTHPRGVLLLSPPGCGKSQFCKALGREVNRPVLILDVGSLMGSLVGQSEERTRQALRIIDAMAPCVLMIDEVEKAFSGVNGSGDSGVSSRMFGTFLSWLNDHTSDVFVVCTSNDMSKLPPEFGRSERFDGIFFLDLPFPEPGIRLIPQQAVTEFDQQVVALRRELDDAVIVLDRHYDELRSAARRRLGDLFDAGDYPPSLIGLFAIEHDYPGVEPPDYLRQLNPELYAQECRRVQSRFDEAVQLAEQAFLDELSRLVEHITERLSGQDDGKPRVFRDSAVTNLTEFFERFRTLNVRSSLWNRDLRFRGRMQC